MVKCNRKEFFKGLFVAVLVCGLSGGLQAEEPDSTVPISFDFIDKIFMDPFNNLPEFCAGFRYIQSLSWNSDGSQLAAAISCGAANGESRSGYVQIFNVTEGKLELANILNVSTEWMESVAFSSDGVHLAAGGHDRKVRIYNPKNQFSLEKSLDFDDHVQNVAFSSDGSLLAVTTGRVWGKSYSRSLEERVKLYNSKKQFSFLEEILFKDDYLRQISFSPDDTKLVLMGQRSVEIYDVNDSLTSFNRWDGGDIFSDFDYDPIITFDPHCMAALADLSHKIRIYYDKSNGTCINNNPIWFGWELKLPWVRSAARGYEKLYTLKEQEKFLSGAGADDMTFGHKGEFLVVKPPGVPDGNDIRVYVPTKRNSSPYIITDTHDAYNIALSYDDNWLAVTTLFTNEIRIYKFRSQKTD